MNDVNELYKKEFEALTNGNPVKASGHLENNLAKYWFEIGFYRGRASIQSQLEATKKELERVLGIAEKLFNGVEWFDYLEGDAPAKLSKFASECARELKGE